ncbi:MAG: family 78 glycoside hydrolase catalytic domain, partial [Acidobacteria bacterium]|nr:family 78 glycoside hydrolase catalytic domain [Acidobacteriota bacterium]
MLSKLVLWIGFFTVMLNVAAPLAAQQAEVPAPAGLRVEYLVDPVGTDVAQPRFSWILEHPERGQKQSAYQVLVSAAPAASGGDQWDSGRVTSGQSVNVVYAGKPLQSGLTYYWKVRYWDKNGAASPSSAVARFEMGLLSSAEWKGKWIGGQNQLRKEFTLSGRPVRARAYVTGLGYYELRLNGRKVGNHVLDPAWTTYDKRVLYAAYDITNFLNQGANAVGVMLGEGWYKSRALLLQMNIELEGGRKVEISSDASWKAHQGPILADSIYDGETYDARLATPGWDRPGYDDAGWKAAALVDGPKGVLSAQMMPPIRVVDNIVPVKISSPRAGVYIFDMGQNFSGWTRLRARGPRGSKVTLRHAELLYDDGTLNQENLRAAKATDTYILRGEGEEVYEPRFTYHGFRYVEVTGYPGKPDKEAILGRVTHSAMSPTGTFECSNPMLNQLQHNIQ